jgi:hypothetical protein
MRKTMKQNGGNMAEAQKRIDDWVRKGNIRIGLNLDKLGLRELPLLPNRLIRLYCNNNNLKHLPTLPPTLEKLSCAANELIDLPRLPNKLVELNCEANRLTELPTLPTTLKKLHCYQNRLKTLPLLPRNLEILDCNTNELTELPQLPYKLIFLGCNDNIVSELPELPNNLVRLYCYINQLTKLPHLPNSLQVLSCHDNKLTELPSLPNSLLLLSCEDNQLTELPKLPNGLLELSCYNNEFTHLPTFPSSLIRLESNNSNRKNDTLIQTIKNMKVQKFNTANIKTLEVIEPVNVFDAIEYSDIPLTIQEIRDDSEENIYFKAGSSFFRIEREYLMDSIKKNENIIYNCNKALTGAPSIENIFQEKPYFLLRTSAIYAVPLEYLNEALQNIEWVYELKDATMLEFTASITSIVRNAGRNFRGRRVNIVSADHCQTSSNRQSYSIQPIELVPKPPNIGGKSRTRKNRAVKTSKN